MGIHVFWRKRPYEDIDPAIRPLVDRMNGTGAIRTIASCQGHALQWKAPYVYFHAPVEVATAINRQLRELEYRDDPSLHFFWMITGHFNENHDLVFRLESPQQNKRAGTLLDQMTPVGLMNRRRLDADYLALALLIEWVIANLRD